MLAASLTLSVLEIVLLLFGAIILGITIHFFITSNKSLNATTAELEKPGLAQDEWKLKYFNDMEARDKEILSLKERLLEAEENARIYSVEAQEMHRQKRALELEMTNMQKASPQTVPVIEKERTNVDYLEQLRQAQTGLVEQNQKINQLLENIDFIKEKEEMQREILRSNEELSAQIGTMRVQLSEKEKEISQIRQKEQLTNEMKAMLDSTYHEFNTLQNKIHKMESQLNSAKLMNLEYEDLKEVHVRMSRDFDEYKAKVNALTTDNKHLQSQLAEVEDKLREVNFQKQQLQKRTAYLEELNKDLQVVSDTNKKLESQLKKVGELESMLNVVSEERDQLMRNREE
jgi:FtsZ-binding cell division protein ZapB